MLKLVMQVLILYCLKASLKEQIDNIVYIRVTGGDVSEKIAYAVVNWQ